MVNSQSSIVNKTQVVFFGAGPYVVPIIETLNREFDLTLVVTTESEPGNPVLSLCSKNDVKIMSVGKFNSHILEQIKGFGARIAVLASFGIIVPDEVLNLFELGIINIHPSLLPKYRGPTPVQSAILAGETQTGVSIIKLDSEVDHGPILWMIDHLVSHTDTSESLYKILFQKGADLLVKNLPRYLSGELKPTEQDHSKATFTEHLIRDSGFVDINKPPTSEQLDRMIRAYYPWPGVWFKSPTLDAGSRLKNKIIKLLPEQKIQVEGKNVMKLSDFANGYPEGQSILSRLSLS